MRHLNDNGIDFSQFYIQQSANSLTGFSDYRDRIRDRLNGVFNKTGATLPWPDTDHLIRFRSGELTIWGGINGHGKSMMLSQFLLFAAPLHTSCIASFEMPIDTLGARIIRQASGVSEPSIKYMDSFIDWSDGKLWVYDKLGSVTTADVEGAIKYAATEKKVKHFVIDSLMKCGIAPDDYTRQKDFVDRLCNLAKDLEIHIHLVCHIRKADSERRINKFDVAGAGAITDLADNVCLVWRNKSKERRLAAGEEVEEGEPDTLLIVDKQRHGDWEGTVNLYYHPDSYQYMRRPSRSAMPWPSPQESNTFFGNLRVAQEF